MKQEQDKRKQTAVTHNILKKEKEKGIQRQKKERQGTTHILLIHGGYGPLLLSVCNPNFSVWGQWGGVVVLDDRHPRVCPKRGLPRNVAVALRAEACMSVWCTCVYVCVWREREEKYRT